MTTRRGSGMFSAVGHLSPEGFTMLARFIERAGDEGLFVIELRRPWTESEQTTDAFDLAGGFWVGNRLWVLPGVTETTAPLYVAEIKCRARFIMGAHAYLLPVAAATARDATHITLL